MAESEITLSITRFDPDRDQSPRQEEFRVPFKDQNWVVLDALNYVKGHVDGSLSYRWSCRMGICGSCGMMVNGTPKLTCSAFVRDYQPGTIKVEPLANFPIIRDLVIDMEDFMRKLKSVKPWIVRRRELPLGGGEHLLTNLQTDSFRQFSACINCMLCYAACPVYALEPEFLGPAATALARRYDLDPRDEGNHERMPFIAHGAGVWDCSFVGECSVVCPKGVDPARAIQQSKLETTMTYLMPFGTRA